MKKRTKTTEDSNKQKADLTPDRQEPKESTWLSYPKQMRQNH